MSTPDTPLQALVSLVVGRPEEPYEMAYARSWLIDPATAEAFAEEMTKRYGEPIQSMQEVRNLGGREGLVMLDPREDDTHDR